MEIFFNIDETEKGFLYEESMRMLRTNLQFSGGNLRVILFTSSIQDEGKSETSFQLAISFAKLDKKVLYVDADMRKSVFTSRYQIKENVQGLSQYLSGQNTEDIVYKTNIKNMDVVFAGPPLANIVDAAVIGRCVDGAVIVVKSATVSQRMVKRVKDQLEKVNCKIIGAVLNGVEMKKNSYHYKYYGDYYGNKK